MQIVDYNLYWSIYNDIIQIIKYNYFTIHLLPPELFDTIMSYSSSIKFPLMSRYGVCRLVSKEWNEVYQRYHIEQPLIFWFSEEPRKNFLLFGPDNQFIYPRYLWY